MKHSRQSKTQKKKQKKQQLETLKLDGSVPIKGISELLKL
jgi:hypothetical protein